MKLLLEIRPKISIGLIGVTEQNDLFGSIHGVEMLSSVLPTQVLPI